jgi:phosphatidate cytidylyltransferase
MSEAPRNSGSPVAPRRFADLLARALVALVGIPLVTWIVMVGGWYFFLFMEIAGVIALVEFYALAKRKETFPNVTFGVAGGVLMMLPFVHERLEFFIRRSLNIVGDPTAHYPSQFIVFISVALLGVFAILATEVVRNRANAFFNTAITVFGVFYISLFMGCIVGLREMFDASFPTWRFVIPASEGFTKLQQVDRWGGYMVMSVLAGIWVCDSAAYFAGSMFGKHKLLPRVSPGKSWEGSVAGFIASVGLMIAARAYVLPFLALRDAIVIGVIIGVFGQLGDLAESLIKRDAGAKDSSHLLPGHGGAFDRFDSLLFAAPLVYLYVYIVITR